MQIFIKRPVMSLAINLLIIVIGIGAWSLLPLRHKVEVPGSKIIIQTKYKGASSKVMLNSITNNLEKSLLSLEGVEQVTSKSFDEKSQIQVKLSGNKLDNFVLSQVKDKVHENISYLPKDIEGPYIFEQKQDEPGILLLQATHPGKSTAEVYDYIDRYILDKMSAVSGVAYIDVYGGEPYSIYIELEPSALADNNLTIHEVVGYLEKERMYASVGVSQTRSGYKTITIDAPFTTIDDLKKLIIHKISDQEITSIKLEDIGEITVKPQRNDYKSIINLEETVMLVVYAKPNANPLDVSNNIKRFIANNYDNFPNNFELKVNLDQTDPFKLSLSQMYWSIFEAIIVVGIVLFIFIGSFRASIISLTAIPICIIGVCIFLTMFGCSINPITLLALALAIGLVVDDGIIVIENIYKHIEQGKPTTVAVIDAAKEISLSIIIMTLTLSAVYLPIIFQTGESAYILREFAITLAGSVLISGVVALTLVPALTNLFLKDVSFSSKLDNVWQKFVDNFASSLIKFISMFKTQVLIVAAIIILTIIGYKHLPYTLYPAEDNNIIYGWFSTRNTVSESVQTTWFKELDKILQQQVPEKTDFNIGTYDGNAWWHLNLVPRQKRNRSAATIAQQLEPFLQQISGPEIGVEIDDVKQNSDKSFALMVQYSGEIDELISAISLIEEDLNDLDELRYAWSDELDTKERLEVKILRDIATNVGVSIDDIEKNLHGFFTGENVFRYNFKSKEYLIIVKAKHIDLEQINQFFVKNAKNEFIPLGMLVDIKQVTSPTFFSRTDGILSATIRFAIDDNYSVTQALHAIKPILDKYLPDEASIKITGKLEKFQKERYSMFITFVFSICLIYLLLSILFESFLSPIVILTTVPFALVGGLIGLNIISATNNVYSFIAVITLIGLITKHGVLLVDFIQKYIALGNNLQQAIILAAKTRLRPILMTSSAMIAGAIPLLFSVGYGANARIQIAVVTVGGIISGTILSLYLLPVIYQMLFSKVYK